MIFRRVAVAVFLGAAVVATLHAQAIERSLYVSVVDESGAPVSNLGPQDFIVREDNVAREVLRVVPATEPMQVAILVDNSLAATSHIAHLRDGLPPFVDALTSAPVSRGHNEVAIVGLGERPTIFADYTSDPGALRKGIARIWPMGGTYLLEGLIEVTAGLKKREAQRPVIVALTTEGPELSSRHWDLVLRPLKDTAAALNVIVLGSPSGDTSDDAHTRDYVIDEGTKMSGGVRDQLLTSMALTTRLKQLANMLTHEYRVTYARPDSLIPPERVTVAAKRSNLTARGTIVKEQQQGRP